MPASFSDPVSSALHLSLTANDKNPNDLDNRLISSAKSVLLNTIEFEETGTYQSDVLEGLKSKYIILKADKRLNEDKSLKKEPNSQFAPARTKQENVLPSPKKILFPLSSVRLGWESGWQVGTGMQNVGNTCYLNSTLQALFHVPAFANWLMSFSHPSHHSEGCTQNGCVICCMKKTLMDSQSSMGPIKPWQVYAKLRQICRHLIPGRQEDAHEFLRYLVESMEKTFLAGLGAAGRQLEQHSKETTPLNQILGGYLRSAVRCLACGHVSTTFQHFQDLLVDARRASTLDEALESFFTRERLEDLGYKCESCNKKVSATNHFFVERAPMVLCIALKRFSATGGKVSKHIMFRPRVSLKKFMFSQDSQAMMMYRLVSVVTHLGPSQNCGHYTSVGLGPGGTFYHFDDSCVRPIPISNVVNTNAYIMFYELEKAEIPKTKFNGQSSIAKSTTLNVFTKKESDESGAEKKSFIGPVLPESLKNKENSPIKIKFGPIKVNGASDTNQKLYVFHPNENGVSSSSSSYEKSPSKLFLNLPSTYQSQAGNSQNTNGKFINKTFSNDNSFRKANVLSPSKSTNIQNGTHPASVEVKTNNDSKPFSPGAAKHNGSLQNGTAHTNGEMKPKSKLNGDDNKYSPSKPAVNGSGKIGSSPIQYGKTEVMQNGSTKKPSVRLVPYGLESGEENLDDEEEDDSSIRNELSAPRPQPVTKELVTKATDQGWKVSSLVPVAQHSPSLNGVVNSKLIRSIDTCKEQPTVVSNGSGSNGNSSSSNNSNGGSGHTSNGNSNSESQKDVVSELQRYSHRGYGAPVSTWNGHHAQLNRQVFEDRKGQMKRVADEDDEMDRGRVKKVRHNNYNGSKHYNGDFNPFQEVQNQWSRWGDSGGKGGRYPHYNKNFRSRPRGRFVRTYAPRHHSAHHHHTHYGRNR